ATPRTASALLLLAGRQLLVPPQGAVIGRSRECDIVLDDSGISRRHAQIMPAAGGWRIEDLGSTNGLRVNGRRVQGSAQLQGGDRVEMGSTEIVFELR
ncbi:MAG: FHA domain-containing protein, partial [Solirubrobacteraceae bacterium]